MNVLHITPAFHPAHVYGGPIESVYRLCRSLAEQGQVRVLTTNANGADKTLSVDTSREIETGVGLRVDYCHRIMRHAVAPSLLRLLPSYVSWADIVHLTGVYSFPTIPTLLACRILCKPIVWSPRGALQRWEGSTKQGPKAAWEWACGLVAPQALVLHLTSEEEARASLARFPSFEAAVIPNGVEIPEQVTHVPRDGTLRLLYLGRLHPIKGIENLLAACKQLNDNAGIAWSLTVAGTGKPEYSEALKTRTCKLGLNQQVKIVGEVLGRTKRGLFENADIMVVPSYAESFGMVVAEALAQGIPVIASTGTPWRRLEEIGCGFWASNDPESLADAIQRMSKMPLRDMGRKGREWMAKEFAWPSVAAQMMQTYCRLMARSA